MTIDLNIFNEGEDADASKVNENFQALKAAIAESVNPLNFRSKAIPAEETRENTAYGTLTTPDEIQEVELAENGLIVIGYQATVKESVNGGSLSAIFIGTNQLKKSLSSGAPAVAAASIGGAETNKWVSLFSSNEFGLAAGTGNATQYTGDVTTGQLVGGYLGSSIYGGGFALAFAAAGTYNVSVKFKASSGTITAKDRKIWVATLG